MKTADEHLHFLITTQPLPPDEELTQEMLINLDEARIYFEEFPDNRCIPLLLNTFGQGSGFGVYQLIDNTLKAHPQDLVAHHLTIALQSEHAYIRYWCAQFAGLYQNTEVTASLLILLDNDDDESVRKVVVYSLALVGIAEVKEALQRALSTETEESVCESIREVLPDLE